MNICVIGMGYVGLTISVGLAGLGNRVISVDLDEAKINELRQGKISIYEPGLAEALKVNLANRRLAFTTSLKESVLKASLIFITVGTPPKHDNTVDLSQVTQLATGLSKYMDEYKLIVIKSTVPVGTCRLVEQLIKASQVDSTKFDLVSNPEFLREGSALKDFIYPDRIVIGSRSSKAVQVMKELYKKIEAPVLVTNPETAEMIKYAANAFLATKISFINEIAGLCEKFNLDVVDVAKGIGLDARIGRYFLNAGLGFGGSCLPKDLSALIAQGRAKNCRPQLLSAVMEVNRQQAVRFCDKIKHVLNSYCGGMAKKTVAVLGLSFKPNTDDIREAPSLKIIDQLICEGVQVKAYDPAAMTKASVIFPTVKMTGNPYQAAAGSDALLLLTEWEQFKKINWVLVKKLLRYPLVFDGRNICSPREMAQLGFIYYGVGRAG